MFQTPTLMQIDLQNLFFAAKNRGKKVDFEKIWHHFHERESEFLTDAIVYMVNSPTFNSKKFENKLKNIGYNIRIKKAERIHNSDKIIYKQTDHDVNITIECLDRIQQFDKWILMSGDGDFVDLCSYLKKKEKTIEIWSFQENFNSSLDPYIDRTHFIEDEFFYSPPNIHVFGFNQRNRFK